MKTYEAVLLPVEQYISGTYNADISLLKQAFHPQAHMSGYLGETFLCGSPDPFFEDIASMPAMGAPYRANVLSVEVFGQTASVTMHETGFRGTTNFIVNFQLILENGLWRIISKNFETV